MRYSDIIEGKLVKKDLMKNPQRLANFIKKYETGQPFVAIGSTTPTIKLKKDDEVLKDLKQGVIPDTFETVEGRMVRLSGLEKTSEFGGKPAGFSTRDEDAALVSINQMFAKLKGSKSEMPLVIGNRTVNVAKFVTTPKTPKSDFHAVDASGNEVAWISHKKGSKAKDFGQWGGVSDRELAIVYKHAPEIKDEVDSFVQALRKLSPNEEFPKGVTFARKLKDGRLRGIAIYGIGWGGNPGPQNVDLVLQGDPQFDGNRLVATGSAHANKERLEGEFEPILMARYSSDRNNFGIKGARVGVYPAGGRKVTKYV
tara:strand:- start:31456 stop:32391 length:936 start_codon:yes stop_codon:yes gene_type:complete